jgi:hypothetical protein
MFQTTNQNILKYMIPLSNQSQCLDGYLKLNPPKKSRNGWQHPKSCWFRCCFSTKWAILSPQPTRELLGPCQLLNGAFNVASRQLRFTDLAPKKIFKKSKI